MIDDGAALERLATLLRGRRFVALTGAGCSTESGIPDYRGEGRTGPRQPIQHDAYLRRPEVRQRYWARATLGWLRFSAAQPNAAHRALAILEQAGPLAGIITQNVDRLHHAAGSRRVVELHGALAEVRCLACASIEKRDSVQARLLTENPDWVQHAAAVAPDGDADLPEEAVTEFRVVPCAACGGVLMPNVVFFGGNVPEATVRAAWDLFDAAEVLLVVGSSLTVYSGFRFVRRASERGVPVGVINLGPTRADDAVQVRVAEPAGEVLPRLAAALTGHQMEGAPATFRPRSSS
ncbi:MAG TPA: NAD-dependent protein deacetylase [Polyangia bacterium]|jgi:NAD-dependent SIR2 family protein deacetylase|nr:NAD-dependent protein deacetylase [Polyangia bacterium]